MTIFNKRFWCLNKLASQNMRKQDSYIGVSLETTMRFQMNHKIYIGVSLETTMRFQMNHEDR